MTSRDFCFWLQGYLELEAAGSDKVLAMTGNGPALLVSPGQLECIRRHLALVFKHEIDPSMGGPQKQQDLNQIHDAKLHPSQNPGGLVMRC